MAKTGSWKSMQPKAAKDKKYYKKKYKKKFTSNSLMNHGSKVEYKSIDSTLSADINSTGQIILLNGSAQGVADGERIGTNLQLKSMHYQLCTYFGSEQASYRYRIIVFYDKSSQGLTPTVFNNSARGVLDSAATSTGYPELFKWLANKDKYVIISDKTYVNNVVVVGQQKFIEHEKYKKLNGTTEFLGVGGTATSISSGSLWMLILGTDPYFPTHNPQLFGHCRVRYTDQ